MSNPVLIHEIHDMWPATLIEMGGMSRNNPFVKILQIAENSAYRHSDKVVSVLPNTEEYMRRHGLSEGRFHYIPNGIVTKDWDNPEELPANIDEKLKQIKAGGRFIVGYFGGHGLSNALDSLLDAAKQIYDTGLYSNITIVMVGDGAEKNRLKQRIENEQIGNIVMFNSVSKKCIPNLLKHFDCIYIGTKNSSLYRFGLGLNKFYDAMMSGKPIILSTNATNTVIEEAGCGEIVSAEDSGRIIDAMIKMYELSEEERKEIGMKGKRKVLGEYTYDNLAKKFEAVMGDGKGYNILYIEHYAGSPDMGMEYRPYYLAQEWIKSGHRVDIVAADYSHLRRHNPEIIKDFDEEVIDDIHYHWVHTGRYSGNGAKRAFTMFVFVGKLIIRAKRISKQLTPDVIISSSTYPLDTYVGQLFRRLTRSNKINNIGC